MADNTNNQKTEHDKLEKNPKSSAQRIRSLKSKAGKRVGGRVSKEISGFADFLREQSVVGIAVGLVLGTQIKVIVDQFVSSFLNPALGILLPGTGGLAKKNFTVYARGKPEVFYWGAFVSTLISFVFLAAIVYYTIKALKLDKLKKT
jgi:large conductance mechanosensitive channel protein